MVTDEDKLLRAMRDAWAETPGIDAEAVPLGDGFFDAGGNSLLPLLLWEQFNELTDRRLRATDLFQHLTVRDQAALMASGA